MMSGIEKTCTTNAVSMKISAIRDISNMPTPITPNATPAPFPTPKAPLIALIPREPPANKTATMPSKT
jgi:hypothetical protein